MEDVKHTLEVLWVSVIQSCTVPRVHVLHGSLGSCPAPGSQA